MNTKQQKEKKTTIEDEFSVETKNEFQERIGDKFISFTSSWLFLFLNVLFFLIWVWLGLYYDILTFIVSLEAIILTILILISNTIKEKSDRERAIKDYKMNYSVAKKVKRMENDIKEIKSLLKK